MKKTIEHWLRGAPLGIVTLLLAVLSVATLGLWVSWSNDQLEASLSSKVGLTVAQAANLQIVVRDLRDEVRQLKAEYQETASLQVAVNLTKWAGGLRKVWEPESVPKGVIILHQGHSSFAGNDMHGHRYPTLDLTEVVTKFVSAGYRVVGFEMPPLPHGEGAIQRFYQPVIDYLDGGNYDDLPVYMVGLSGGGWTTTVVTALDKRIVKGFSIDGDAPSDVAPISDYTDWEQSHPPHDYRTLYAMAGSRLVHIYNFNQPNSPWAGLDGDLGYEYVNDITAKNHTITPWTTAYILDMIAN